MRGRAGVSLSYFRLCPGEREEEGSSIFYLGWVADAAGETACIRKKMGGEVDCPSVR